MKIATMMVGMFLVVFLWLNVFGASEPPAPSDNGEFWKILASALAGVVALMFGYFGREIHKVIRNHETRIQAIEDTPNPPFSGSRTKNHRS